MNENVNENIIFETGSLSKENLEAILETLPVDITFVDKNDTVQFFNRLGKRIFPRTKNVIGKEVRKCHPPKSINKVNQILTNFKNGKRSEEEFWINLKDELVYIRYFAVRNKYNEYLGCLEVSQNITKIKNIEGEKRLL